MNIPAFLLPIIALEVIAVLTVILAAWMLLTGKVDGGAEPERVVTLYPGALLLQAKPKVDAPGVRLRSVRSVKTHRLHLRSPSPKLQ